MRFRPELEPTVHAALASFPALSECFTCVFLSCLCVCGVQDQRLKEMGMQTPPSASPSSQAINSANNNHIAPTPELFPSSLSANRCAPSHFCRLFFSRHPSSSSALHLCRSLCLPSHSVPNLNSDLFDLQPAFIPALQSTPSISTANSAWGGMALTHTNTHQPISVRAGQSPLHPWSCSCVLCAVFSGLQVAFFWEEMYFTRSKTKSLSSGKASYNNRI